MPHTLDEHILNRNFSRRRKWHIHKCKGLKSLDFKWMCHFPHFWLCHNPFCTANEVYLCGIIQDVIYCYEEGKRKSGRKSKNQFRRT